MHAPKVCLINVLVFSRKGLPELREALERVCKLGEVEKASSVYLVNGNINDYENIHNLREVSSYVGLSLCLRMRTEHSAIRLSESLWEASKQLTSVVSKKMVEVALVAYEGESLMTPALTLPHPELVERPELLVPAAELWGNYHHPVLEENLTVLAKKFNGVTWGEFFTQSKSVLDF